MWLLISEAVHPLIVHLPGAVSYWVTGAWLYAHSQLLYCSFRAPPVPLKEIEGFCLTEGLFFSFLKSWKSVTSSVCYSPASKYDLQFYDILFQLVQLRFDCSKLRVWPCVSWPNIIFSRATIYCTNPEPSPRKAWISNNRPFLSLDSHAVFASNDFWVLAMPKCYILGRHTKFFILFTAFTDLILHLPMHNNVLNPAENCVSQIPYPEFPRMLYYGFKDMLYVIFKWFTLSCLINVFTFLVKHCSNLSEQLRRLPLTIEYKWTYN